VRAGWALETPTGVRHWAFGRSSGRYGVAYGVGGWRRAALQQVHTEEGTSKRSQMARDSQARAAAELFVCLFACLLVCPVRLV
jgi:hypothetical protein